MRAAIGMRGFLGPIGDDLPSLAPLLLALIIFFSTFTLTFTIFSHRSDDFSSDLAALSVARIMKASSYVTNIKHFETLCSTLTAYNINYTVGITDAFTHEPSGTVDIFDTGIFYESPGHEPYLCQHLKTGETYSEAGTSDRTVLVRVYPVALEQERVVYPMHLVVAVWR